ncbi:hypothetical protein [Curtobacterium sp. MCPF17_052]|nr:hypothetical protein [Curtobacterium sp. MCPF17_052]WIB11818.1 hypothetical protein DEJ36_13135 [Curtobacterium sp. MCPF17_052]
MALHLENFDSGIRPEAPLSERDRRITDVAVVWEIREPYAADP